MNRPFFFPREGRAEKSRTARRAVWTLLTILLAASTAWAADPAAVDWHKSALHSPTPDAEVLHLNIGGSPKPNVLERWWHGKRCRWLDESGTMRADDLRGDQLGDVLQVDMDGDGTYDGPDDMNVKWCDTDGDGIPDVQTVVVNPTHWGEPGQKNSGHPVYMIFLNHDQKGVLGWIDWNKFDFNCWGYTGLCDWLPNYHGNSDFVKIHQPSYALTDLRFNWENPFSFYDVDGTGVSKMAMRWCGPQAVKDGRVEVQPEVNYAFVTYDIDGSAAKGNETSYDMTLHGKGTAVDIKDMVHPLPHYTGDPKFDPCFVHNEWRRIKEVVYMDRDKGPNLFFTTKWKSMFFVFDEDGDDHRWERVEMMYPTDNLEDARKGTPVDLYSTARLRNKEGKPMGLGGHPQADSLGDRGEFDLDNRGGGKMYIGGFDRKLHLYGANWGAWTVDKNAEFHGGVSTPSTRPSAPKVEEVVKYTDTDGDGFIDTIEYDYDGDRQIDLKVCLLDYKDKDGKAPETAPLIDPQQLGWKGMHETFDRMAQAGWVEALQVYRAAWRRDLTTPELDKLAAASSMMQRYQNGYWIKEEVFREIRRQAVARMAAHPEEQERLKKFLADYIRAYYTGHFDEVVRLIGEVPERP